MNDIINSAEALFADIKCDFSSLWNIKKRGETIEFITPYAMLSGEFVSVFVTQRQNGYVISDGGRLQEIAEEQKVDLETRNRIHHADMLDKYAVAETFQDGDNRRFHYKITPQMKMISACVYDLARFQEIVANAIFLDTLFDEEESEEIRHFKSRVKELLVSKTKLLSTPDNRYELYADEATRHYHFTTGICEVRTQRIWLGMSVSRSNLTNYQQSVKNAEYGFRHLLKRPPVENPILAAIIAPLPDTLKTNATAQRFQIDMDEWKSDLNVSTYSYDQIEQLQTMTDLFCVA